MNSALLYRRYNKAYLLTIKYWTVLSPQVPGLIVTTLNSTPAVSHDEQDSKGRKILSGNFR
jgi:hypothetical protein